MIAFYIVIIGLMLAGIGWQRRNPFNEDDGALSRATTDSIKGIFILVVFMRHIWPYIGNVGIDWNFADRLFITADSMVRQLLVVMFLFYSGYGVSESIKRKGPDYIKSFPRHRILTTWLNFAVAVSVFIIVGNFIGTGFTLSHSLLSLIGWESAGNSNWYIFCILCCYASTYAAFRIGRSRNGAIAVQTVASCFYIIVLQYFNRGGYWYNTIFAYLFGLTFSLYKPHVTHLLQNRYWIGLPLLAIGFLFFYSLAERWNPYCIVDNLYAILFAGIVVMLTMKIRIGSRALRWFGKNLFPIYIYQRLPMILLVEIAGGAFLQNHYYLYIVSSMAITIGIAFLYPYISIKNIKTSSLKRLLPSR